MVAWLISKIVDSQVISCPASAYELQKAAMNLTIQHAVASCVDGVPPEQVTTISMVAATYTASSVVAPIHNLRGSAMSQSALPSPAAATEVSTAAASWDTNEFSLLTYQVTSNDHHATAESLMAQLTDAATTGRLEEALRRYALIYQVQPLANATLGAPILVDATADYPSASQLSAAHLAGIAAGSALGLFVILYSASAVLQEKSVTKVWPYLEDCDSEMDSVVSTEPGGPNREGNEEMKEGFGEEEARRPGLVRPFTQSFAQVSEFGADAFAATPSPRSNNLALPFSLLSMPTLQSLLQLSDIRTYSPQRASQSSQPQDRALFF